jgi:hypothetical protein
MNFEAPESFRSILHLNTTFLKTFPQKLNLTLTVVKRSLRDDINDNFNNNTDKYGNRYIES